MDQAHERARSARDHYAPVEPRALGVIAGLAALAILWVVLPLGIGVLVGALLAFTVDSTYRALLRRRWRSWVAASLLTAGATLVVTGTLAIFVWLLILQGVKVVGAAPDSLAKGGPADTFFRHVAAPLSVIGLSPDDIVARLRGAIGSLAESLAAWAAQVVGAVFDGVVTLVFMVLTMYFVLVNGRELAQHAEGMLPINPRHTRRLLQSVRRIGRQVVLGNFGTAVVQGALAGVAYWIAGLPQPAFFGAMTALFSLVPVVGTPIVWVPAGVGLALAGHVGGGVFLLIWGALVVVAFCDYVVRPRLVGGRETMSNWLSLVAIFGGLKVFGFVGVLLGPLLCGVAVAALRLYERTRRFRLRLG